MSEGAAGDWVSCLVLTIAPQPYRDQIVEAVRRAEAMIFSDPVLVDLARVATTESPDPLAQDLDALASALHRELVTWARSPARNPAPRCVFCVVLWHPDQQEARRLTTRLAETAVLSELPIVFQVGELTPSHADDAASDGMTRVILDAALLTAREVEKAPEFCLTVDVLDRLVPGHAAVDRRAAERAAPEPLQQDSESPTVENPAPAVADDRAAAAADDAEEHAGDETAVPRRRPGAAALRRLAGSARTLLARRPVPASNIAVIRDLSARTAHVSMLYVVHVSEPVRPSRESRAARVDIAWTLARTLMAAAGNEREAWHVRTFTAADELRAGTPLPAPDVLRRRDLPERWGDHFDLYDSAGDIIDHIDRDTSSFRRRGVDRERVVVVFLAGPAPSGGADAVRRLSDLCDLADTIWVAFDEGAAVDDDVDAAGVCFLSHHDDLADELLELVISGRESDVADAGSESDVVAARRDGAMADSDGGPAGF